MAGTIPADIAQFYWHALVLCQKLAYLYGWPDLLVHGEVDEETEQKFTLLIGAMMGAGLAQQGLVKLSNHFAAQVGNRLPRQALTKHTSYNLTKQVGKWIGVRITKSTLSRGLQKLIPVVGGGVSAGFTAVMMRGMARNLRGHLKGLVFASPEGCPETANEDGHSPTEARQA